MTIEERLERIEQQQTLILAHLQRQDLPAEKVLSAKQRARALLADHLKGSSRRNKNRKQA